jgi:CO/xanthine dehydrogenase FAD-binding subunit
MFHTNYIAPGSLEELLTVLHHYSGEARVVAGGTDLIPQMRLGKLTPGILVDPHHLALTGITETKEGVYLGALVTHTQALTSPLLKQAYPALVNACQQVGGPPVRNRGTLAGNLANASPAADSALPLLVYDAQVVVSRMSGERMLPLSGFYLGPGQTQLSSNEFIREIMLPKLPLRTMAVFLKLGNRQAMVIAVTSIAIRLSLDEAGQVNQARIALGSVAPIPLRAYQAETVLQSYPLDEKTIRLAAQSARQAACPISDLRATAEYRSKMVEVLTRRALNILCSRMAAGDDYG